MPYITQVAVGRRSHLNVFGNDYETPDGTGCINNNKCYVLMIFPTSWLNIDKGRF